MVVIAAHRAGCGVHHMGIAKLCHGLAAERLKHIAAFILCYPQYFNRYI
jgi:hypothetical protein